VIQKGFLYVEEHTVILKSLCYHTILEAVIWKSYVFKRENMVIPKSCIVCVLVGSTVISKLRPRSGLNLGRTWCHRWTTREYILKWLCEQMLSVTQTYSQRQLGFQIIGSLISRSSSIEKDWLQ